jgi:hypothetical protein
MITQGHVVKRKNHLEHTPNVRKNIPFLTLFEQVLTILWRTVEKGTCTALPES